jgi:peptidoglycan hydrolase-like protein with peptidoglycan-binding domain
MSLTGTPLLARESTGPYVVQLQRLLSVSPVTGFFGPITESAVIALQKATGLSQTGTTTESTWKAVRAGTSSSGGTTAPPPPTSDPAISARALPSRMSYRVVEGDSLSRIASRWRSTVDGIRSASSLESDVLQVGQVLTLPVRSTLTRFTYKALRKGDKNGAVQALQTAMRMRPKYRTGVFGDITARNVNGLKVRHGWPADGKVGIGVWRALGA